MTVPHLPGFARALREADRTLLGTWVKIPSLETVEILAIAGFDFVVIDMEHSPLDLQSAYAATVVAQGAGMQVLVRTPDRSGSHLQRLLDSGVDGILVPRVESVEAAAAAARAMTFSPAGERGNGSTSRAGAWGGIDLASYLTRGDDILRAVQIEDLDGLQLAEAILDVPHLTGAFIGMGDLQLSSGLRSTDPVIDEAVTQFLARAAERGLPVGTAVQSAEQVEAAARRGYSFVMASNDTGLLRSAASTLVGEVRHRLDSL